MNDGLLIDQLRLIGRAAIGFVVILCCCFGFVFWLADFPLLDYRQASNQLFQSRLDLPWMMWLGGALILLITALSLWLSCLFITHRAVGPLYRFSRNLETALNQDSAPFFGIRSDDHFQQDSQQMLRTASRLAEHEEQLVSHCRELIQQFSSLDERATSSDSDDIKRSLKVSLEQLKTVASQGRIDAN